MKKKIVIKVTAHCDKCRSKAMKVAAVEHGVISVALEGNDKDRLVVIGEGVDAVCLTASLRKKAGYATLESVEEVKPPPPKKEEPKKPDEKKPPPPPPPCIPICHQPHVEMYNVVYDSYGPTPSCTIM